MRIREATSDDRDAIHRVHWEAFPAEERGLVAQLAVDLLQHCSDPPVLSLVAEVEGEIVAHVAFSPVTFEGDETLRGYLLAPLGIKPSQQRRGIGSQLVQHGMRRLTDQGVDVLLVYGDPRYYERFGFSAESADRFAPPFDLEYPHGWLAKCVTPQAAQGNVEKVACKGPLNDPRLW